MAFHSGGFEFETSPIECISFPFSSPAFTSDVEYSTVLIIRPKWDR
jgi:hypothetical protein